MKFSNLETIHSPYNLEKDHDINHIYTHHIYTQLIIIYNTLVKVLRLGHMRL